MLSLLMFNISIFKSSKTPSPFYSMLHKSFALLPLPFYILNFVQFGPRTSPNSLYADIEFFGYFYLYVKSWEQKPCFILLNKPTYTHIFRVPSLTEFWTPQ